MQFRRWYDRVETLWGSIYHTWYVVGPQGGVHCHITVYRNSDVLPDYPPSGGIECHWNEYRPEFDRAPDHLECQVTKRPCWHDGSSLYVSENIVPALNFDRIRESDHAFVFHICEEWYMNKIHPGGNRDA